MYNAPIPANIVNQIPVLVAQIKDPTNIQISSFPDDESGDTLYCLEIQYSPRYVIPSDKRKNVVFGALKREIFFDSNGEITDTQTAPDATYTNTKATDAGSSHPHQSDADWEAEKRALYA